MPTPPIIPSAAAAAAGTPVGQQFSQYLSMGMQFFQIFQNGKLVKATTAAANAARNPTAPTGRGPATPNVPDSPLNNNAPIQVRDPNTGNVVTLKPNADGTFGSRDTILMDRNGNPLFQGGQPVSSSYSAPTFGNGASPSGSVTVNGQNVYLQRGTDGNYYGQTSDGTAITRTPDNHIWVNDTDISTSGNPATTIDGRSYAINQDFNPGVRQIGTLNDGTPVYAQPNYDGSTSHISVGDPGSYDPSNSLNVSDSKMPQALNDLRLNNGWVDPNINYIQTPTASLPPGVRQIGTLDNGTPVYSQPNDQYSSHLSVGEPSSYDASNSLNVPAGKEGQAFNNLNYNNGWVDPSVNYFPPPTVADTWPGATLSRTLDNGTEIWTAADNPYSTSVIVNDGGELQNFSVPPEKLQQALGDVTENGGFFDPDAIGHTYWEPPTAMENFSNSFKSAGGLAAWAGVALSGYAMYNIFSSWGTPGHSLGGSIFQLALTTYGMMASYAHIFGEAMMYGGPYAWAAVGITIAVIAVVAWAARHWGHPEDEDPNADPSDWDKYLPKKNVVMLTAVGGMLMSIGFHAGGTPSPMSPGLQQTTGVSLAQLNALRTELNAGSPDSTPLPPGSNLMGSVFVIPSGNGISGSGAQYDQALYVTPDSNGDGNYTVTMVDLATDSSGHHFAVGPGQVGKVPFFKVNSAGSIISNPGGTAELNAQLALAAAANDPRTAAGSKVMATWLAACHGNYANCVP